MVICLMVVAMAVLLWPVRVRVALPRARWARRGVAGVGPGGGGVRGAEFGLPNGRRPMPADRLGLPIALLAAGCALVGLSFLVAGPAGAVAAGAALTTAAMLARRAVAERRGRLALVDIQAALRMLGRELRAGAEPAMAATDACSAARGAGVDVLHALVRLTRADDRPAVAGPVVAQGRSPDPRSAGVERGRTAAIPAGTTLHGRADPSAQVQARLRSGWLLTRRHGLAFTPLIDALAADLAEQIAAEADRSGQVAGPRMSGYVMAGLPLLGLALGVGMGADPLRVLTSTTVGNLLLAVGVVLTCAGLLWSARIVRR